MPYFVTNTTRVTAYVNAFLTKIWRHDPSNDTAM